MNLFVVSVSTYARSDLCFYLCVWVCLCVCVVCVCVCARDCGCVHGSVCSWVPLNWTLRILQIKVNFDFGECAVGSDDAN